MNSEINFPTGDGRILATSNRIDGQGLKEMIEAGLTWLRTNQQLVNSLNVFPVPDGDTDSPRQNPAPSCA